MAFGRLKPWKGKQLMEKHLDKEEGFAKTFRLDQTTVYYCNDNGQNSMVDILQHAQHTHTHSTTHKQTDRHTNRQTDTQTTNIILYHYIGV